MNSVDLKIFCAALGFTAVVLQGEKLPRKEGMLRATGFASLIEEYCRFAVPEAFEAFKGQLRPDEKFATAQRMASTIVAIYKKQNGCQPQDLIAKGFSTEEVDRHWPMAKALASVEMKMMDS